MPSQDFAGPPGLVAERRATNSATVKVLNILAEFACEQPVFGVTELSQKLGLTKNTVHRALITLVDQGLLVRDASGARYELGFGVLDLQSPFFPAPDFRTLAAPAMEELHAITGATVQLSIRVGDNQVVIDGIEAYGARAVRPKIGRFMALHVSAASRAILAFLPDAEIEDYMRRNAPLRRFTEKTLVMPSEIWEEVRRIRRVGHAETFEDYNRSGSGYSFPVQGADGLPHGTITIGGSLTSFPRQRATELLPLVEAVIQNLRRQCGLYEAQ